MFKFLIVLMSYLAFTSLVCADDLAFPTTEKEIVKLLNQTSEKSIVTPDGTTYISKQGKVYKSINGNLFRVRGLKVVSEMQSILPKAGARVYFDIDSAEIKTESFPILDEFGKALTKGLPDISIMIAGHTDNLGEKEYNQVLSEKRASSVAEYLITVHGIKSKRIVTKGFGFSKPIASNDSEINRSKNRRVEFIRID